jgi:hypothetical protein
MCRRVLTVLIVAGCSVVAASSAHAQFIKFGPNGSVGIRNGLGSYTYVYPDRLNPWANLAVPGSTQQLPNGQIWQGWDGKVHGNVVDPSTGDFHAFMHKSPNGGSQNNGFLEEPASNVNHQPRQTFSVRRAPGPLRYSFGRRR